MRMQGNRVSGPISASQKPLNVRETRPVIRPPFEALHRSLPSALAIKATMERALDTIKSHQKTPNQTI